MLHKGKPQMHPRVVGIVKNPLLVARDLTHKGEDIAVVDATRKEKNDLEPGTICIRR
jgi:hypothetical protein